MGGLLAVLFAFGLSTTTVYAEGTEEVIPETEIVEEVETPENEVIEEEITEEVNSEAESTEVAVEESPLQVWFNEEVMPWLGTALAAAGGTGACLSVLALVIKYLLGKVESKLKEAYEKKNEADKEKEDFNELVKGLTGSLDATVDTLKEIFSQKDATLEQTTAMFAERSDELRKELMNMYNIVSEVTSSNKELQENISAEQKQMTALVDEDMKLLTEVLIIAFTNMPYLVANGYATKIKEVVKSYEEKQI